MSVEPSSSDTQELLSKEILINERSDLALIVLFLAKQKQKSSYRLFPVLFDLIGEESFYALLRVLAGKQVYFPSVSILLEVHTAVSIYKEVDKIRSTDRVGKGRRLDELAKIYKCNAKKLYKKAKMLLG